MNNERRKAIKEAQSACTDIKTTIEDAKGTLEELRDAEQDYYDAMPESLQGGDRGERARAAIDALQNALDNLETMEVEFQALDFNLDTATE